MNYNDSVRKIKGVGEKAENYLHKLDIFQVGDLLEHYPRDYDEFKELVPVSGLREGKVMAVEGVLRRKPSVKNTSNLKVITAFLEDETGVLQITWFNMPFLKNTLTPGSTYIFRGRVQKKKGRLVIATVQGDIHDIGKNIVKTVLENYGYDVLDLGRDVPPETVLEAALREDVRLVGLSALMTTTVGSMEDTIKLLRKEKPDCKIMVGGAVLNKEYADMIGADFYGKDAMQSVYYAKELFAK